MNPTIPNVESDPEVKKIFDKFQAELKGRQTQFTNACFEWSNHPCSAHLYNLELLKTALGNTIQAIHKSGLEKELLPTCNPEPIQLVYNLEVVEEHPEWGMQKVERNYLSALALASEAMLIINKVYGVGRTSGYPELNSFKYLKACLYHARTWLAKHHINRHGFEPPCLRATPVKQGEEYIDRAWVIYEHAGELGL